MAYIRWFEDLRLKDVPDVGSKNASLGEMIHHLKSEGIDVPDGFSTTSEAYREFIKDNQLKDKIGEVLKQARHKTISLVKAGKEIREHILKAEFSESFKEDVIKAYRQLGRKYHTPQLDVAVRSSGTAEDLSDASFAGQQETYLNIRGEKEVLEACKRCIASLFSDRAISYREIKGFDHFKTALSVGVQKMVRSDLAGAGVMFTLDIDTGFRDVIVINACWGLGESVAQGLVLPDEYRVFKPLLGKESFKPIIEKTRGEKEKKVVLTKSGTKEVTTTKRERLKLVLKDEEILQLAAWGVIIEKHYKIPMDIEWAKDGKTGKLFIVQARAEVKHSRKSSEIIKSYTIKQKGQTLIEGLAIGEAIVAGPVQLIHDISEIHHFVPGSILVTEMTSPDWVPIMMQAKGIITDRGGRTSHAAIVSRELGIPAIVGTSKATHVLREKQGITLSCAEGERGYVYEGIWEHEEHNIDLTKIPKVKVDIMLNTASPEEAMGWWFLPCKGIGLARMEFIISNIFKIHPMALVHFDKVREKKVRAMITHLTRGYHHKTDYFVDNLSQAIGHIAASRYPQPVHIRMSDFKSNEYADLIGGRQFEPIEENPTLGLRGASRYYNEKYKEGFALECQAFKKAREELGFENVVMMIPFCRTLEEADKVLGVLAENGLKRGQKNLKIFMMLEVPSNVMLVEEFATRFDGFSIGSNDLTQLLLGIDRDSEELAPLFDERNQAVKNAILELIHGAKKKNIYIGICGQAPSDYPDFALFLMREGIDSISLNPDAVIHVISYLAKAEGESGRSAK